MNLEVGMYVRIDGRKSSSTKYQKFFMIDRIKYIDNCKSKYKYLIKEDKDGYCYTVSDEMIVKASHNIIDLIEVGDYVNGYPVYEIIEYEDNTRAIVIADDNKSIIWEESSQYIKSIVTKEQFENISYKVERKEN